MPQKHRFTACISKILPGRLVGNGQIANEAQVSELKRIQIKCFHQNSTRKETGCVGLCFCAQLHMQQEGIRRFQCGSDIWPLRLTNWVLLASKVCTYLTFPSSYTVTVNMEHLFKSQWIRGTSCLSASGNTWNLLHSCQKLWPCLFIHIMRIKLGIYLTAQCLYGQISVGALKQYLSCHVNNYEPSKFKPQSCFLGVLKNHSTSFIIA